MKTLLTILFLLSLLSFQRYSSFNIADYFGVKVQQYSHNGEESIRIHPVVKDNTQDSIGQFIHRHSKRFEYLLTNRTDLKNQIPAYQEMFPDTAKISHSFTLHLQQRDSFLLYVNTFLTPLQSPRQPTTMIYSEDELMKVASKFFFCDRVNADSTIGMHVCIGLNGIKEARWARDYTLLEAFCFEAIFENLLNDDQQDDEFMKSAAAYRDNISKVQLPQSKTLDEYLERVKLSVFQEMMYDEALEKELLAHYRENRKNLPFEIN